MWHDSFICDMCHVTRLYLCPPGLALIHVYDMPHTYVTWLIDGWRDSFTCETWLIHMRDVTWLIHMWDVTHSYVRRDMTHSYVRHDSFVCETWHDSFICETSLIHMWDMTHSYVRCDMTHSYVRHDSFICETWLIHMWDVTWLIHMWDMTHSYVRHDSFICETWLETWLIHMWDVTCGYATWLIDVWYDSLTRDTCPVTRLCLCVMSHIWMRHDSLKCDMTHWHVTCVTSLDSASASCHTYECLTSHTSMNPVAFARELEAAFTCVAWRIGKVEWRDTCHVLDMCWSVLQCVAVRCNVLQCVAKSSDVTHVTC